MWVIDDKYGRLGIFQNESKNVFLNISLTVVKNYCWQNIFGTNNRTFFACLATADSVSVSISPNANKA